MISRCATTIFEHILVKNHPFCRKYDALAPVRYDHHSCC